MDEATVELLARRAGLEKALEEFPDDVAAAAEQASGGGRADARRRSIRAPSPGRRCAPGPAGERAALADGCGDAAQRDRRPQAVAGRAD